MSTATPQALRWAQEQADARMANLMNATIAFIRPRMVRWLGLLAENTEEKVKSIIANESFQLMSYLIRREELSANAKIQVRIIYPDFDPDVHFGAITRNKDNRIIKFTPANPKTPLTKDLVYALSVWRTAVRHEEFVRGLIKSLELFADGLWKLTGTALIQKITDYTGRTNYAVDRGTAEEIIAEVFPEDVTPNESATEDTST